MDKAFHPSLTLKAVPACGGGRGVFAERDIVPGTLLVKERAIIAMPQDTDGVRRHASECMDKRTAIFLHCLPSNSVRQEASHRSMHQQVMKPLD